MFSSVLNFFNSIGQGVQNAAVGAYNGVKSAYNTVANTVAPYLGGQTAGGATIPKTSSGSPSSPPPAPTYGGTPAPGASGAFYTPQSSPSFMVNQPFNPTPAAPAAPKTASAGSKTANTSSLSYSPSGSSGPNSFMVNQPIPTSITSGAITGNTPITLTPSAPTSPKSYAGTATSGNVAVGADPSTGMFVAPGGGTSKLTQTGTDSTTADQNTAQAAFDTYLKSLKAPPSATDAYNEAIAKTGLIEARQRKQNTQNRINAVTSKMNTDLLQLRGTAAKEGVTEAVYGGQQAEVTREATIQLLPLQAQLAVDQGDVELANENTNTLFKIYSDDAKNSVDFYNNGVKAAWDFFNDQEKKKTADILWQKNQNADQIKTAANNQADIAKEFIKNGNMAGYKAVTSVRIPTNVNSPTFAEDFAAYQKDLANEVARVGATQDTGAGQANLLAYASQYSDTGKLPSPAELKLSGLSVGQVTSYAKQMPKPVGALVSTNTGTKSSALSPTQEAGVTALNEIVNSTLPNLQAVFPKIATGVLGGLGGMVWTSQDKQNYLTWRQEFLSKLLVARSGAAVTEQEYERYSNLLPTTFNQPFFLGSDGSKKLKALSTSMKSNLDSVLNTNQLSIYGYSKVPVNGVERTVGEVLDIGGQKYRVLPDGTLTDQI